jgi:hypothetical protein
MSRTLADEARMKTLLWELPLGTALMRPERQ